jgi:hypothetical protein
MIFFNLPKKEAPSDEHLNALEMLKKLLLKKYYRPPNQKFNFWLYLKIIKIFSVDKFFISVKFMRNQMSILIDTIYNRIILNLYITKNDRLALHIKLQQLHKGI